MMWNISVIEETASTNTLAIELLASGEAKHRDVIQARHQSAGRGRAAGRVWNDEQNASLLMSVVLMTVPEPFHVLHYRVALATVRALRKVAPSPNPVFTIKWPNDILLNGKKMCGVLVETEWNGMEMRSAILGIGINVRQKEFPEELREIATSLFQQGIDLEVNGVRDAVLQELDLEISTNRSPEDLIRELQMELQWMARIPEWTLMEPNGIEISGLRYDSISPTGELRLKQKDGALLSTRSGTLRPSAVRSAAL